MGAASPSKTQRLLDLLSFLAGRRSPATAEQILTEVPAYAERWREGDGGDAIARNRWSILPE